MFQSIAIVFLACGIAQFADAQSGSTTSAPGELRCQYNNGTLMASATICADTLSECVSIFGTAASGTTRAPLCDNEGMQTIAAQCAKTCGICCEQPAYDCTDSATAPINCTANIFRCSQSGWLDIMAQYCPATCGLCQNGTCTDNLSGCASMSNLCQNYKWYTYMSENCARTCGTCSSTSTTTSSCSDIASNCAANSNLCNNSVYYSLMTTNCAKTCGRCGSSSSSSGSSSCTNANSNCAAWVSNGFCSSTFYTTAQKQQYCASSCNLC